MIKPQTILRLVLAAMILALASCAPAQPVSEDATASLPSVTETPLPTDTPTSAATEAAAPTPTLVGSSNGVLIYDDTRDILSVNLDTSEVRVLISRDELELLFGEDKSAESYTYGYKKPIAIELSPDLTKAYISICAALDSRFRCLFEYYIYTLQDKSAIKLTPPAGAYGVYWKWSPDGTKLAGAAWNYVEAEYELTRFYTINSDGTDLRPLAPVTNGHAQLVWHPASRIVIPMTYITNLQSWYIDGSNQLNIPIKGLDQNDKVECLAFSPDGGNVAFVIRREQIKNHDWLYTARSDFSEITLLQEFDIDSRYACDVYWSPDQQYVHFSYAYGIRAETGQANESADFPPLDAVISLQDNTLVQLPENSRVCGWAPNNDLVFSRVDFAGEEVGIELLGLPETESLSLPEDLRSTIKHCPIQWLEEDLAFEVPIGLAVPNACVPGSAAEDEVDEEPIPVLYDMLNASSTLGGEKLTAVMTFAEVGSDLTPYVTSGIDNFYNGWDILVDIDNNTLTGDGLGVEYRLSVAVRPGANGASLGTALVKFNPTSGSYERADTLQVSFSTDTKTVTISGSVPGITETSRLVFLSRLVTDVVNGAPRVISDRICD